MEAEVLAGKKQNLALACAQSDDALTAVGRAAQAGIISPLLVGDEDKIRNAAKEMLLTLRPVPCLQRLIIGLRLRKR